MLVTRLILAQRRGVNFYCVQSTYVEKTALAMKKIKFPMICVYKYGVLLGLDQA